MATIHIRQSTSVPPGRFIAALTNFGPGRGKIFAHSHEDSVTVNARGDDWADVTEGSAGGFCERLRYDWSQPNVARLTNTGSNAWSAESDWVYTLTPPTVTAGRTSTWSPCARAEMSRDDSAPDSWP